MSLYFKFLRFMTTTFLVAALVSTFSISYYWTTSPWDEHAKVRADQPFLSERGGGVRTARSNFDLNITCMDNGFSSHL